jgi:hypothetical protein
VGLLADTLNAPLMATARPYFATLGTLAKLLGFLALAPFLGAAYGAQGYAAAVAISSLLFLAVMVPACVRFGHLALGRFAAAFAEPAVFALLATALCAKVLADAPGVLGRLAVLAISGLGLLAWWAFRRRRLLQLVS